MRRTRSSSWPPWAKPKKAKAATRGKSPTPNSRWTDKKNKEFKGNVATVYANPLCQGGSGNSHYDGNAETYMDVGEAMGQAMVELLKNK